MLRGSHTDTESKDVNDIENLWTDDGTKALSIMAKKNSVYTSQAQSITSFKMGDWKSLNDPVNIQTWTPLAKYGEN